MSIDKFTLMFFGILMTAIGIPWVLSTTFLFFLSPDGNLLFLSVIGILIIISGCIFLQKANPNWKSQDAIIFAIGVSMAIDGGCTFLFFNSPFWILFMLMGGFIVYIIIQKHKTNNPPQN